MTVVIIVYLIVLVMWLYRFSGHAQDSKPIKELDWDKLYHDTENNLSLKEVEKKFKKGYYYKIAS